MYFMKVLFVCTGNTCRSSMAEGIFNHIAREKGLSHVAESAGTMTYDGLPATDEAIRVLKEKYGIDISNHKSRLIKEEHIKDADLVLTMTEAQREFILKRHPEFADKVFTLNEFAGQKGDIEDPFGRGIDVYKKTAEEIYASIMRIIEKL
ncbi:protein tyrosine phosphatase [Thermoanaerobacterium xylanolyticum LX-11]|uniref:Protein tyrosine phosphatase n=2 Tax=Thermoanaerobacterium xylanolyticum TaxID=29329 RepID=F6BL68_THEXL|nr:protein tyrosine phosphatase [Thermoanaerobacterium xylanolyticum LX-11]